MPNDIQLLGLATRLRALATGRVEWRVQHPVKRSYCMVVEHHDSTHPKGEAEAWLIDFQRRHPDHPHAKYEVAEVRVFSELEEAALEAAEALEKIVVRAASIGERGL